MSFVRRKRVYEGYFRRVVNPHFSLPPVARAGVGDARPKIMV